MWISIWFIGVPSNMGVVAVYALNDEFKSILRESKNGMVTASSYILAKTVLVIPIMFIFAAFAIGVPGFVIQDFLPDTFVTCLILYSAVIYVFECAAEAFAVMFEDPILGMLQFTMLWFGTFLFAGFLIPLRDMYWPFELFYYILPFGYWVRSHVYTILIDAQFAPCFDPLTSAVCSPTGIGSEVLDGLGRVFPLISSENMIVRDILTLLALALLFKITSITLIILKTRKVANIA